MRLRAQNCTPRKLKLPALRNFKELFMENSRLMSFKSEIAEELTGRIIPFWKSMRDNARGGFYGLLDCNLNLDRNAPKGCILNSRILWFFSSACKVLGDEGLAEYARHAYSFLKEFCLDKKNGGVFWSLNADGTVLDSAKHTYNQAFAIYALSSYYGMTGDAEALETALSLFKIIEEKCTDEGGYLESFTQDFKPESNEKLSENGVLADRTMNTLLHVMEAYTGLYQVSKNQQVKERLQFALTVFAEKIWNAQLKRQEVFFDKSYRSLIDLYSYGHDIESSWLIDRALEVLGDSDLSRKLAPVTQEMAQHIYSVAFKNGSVLNECDRGAVNETRVWWIQAESIVGFFNAYQKTGSNQFLDAAISVWQFIKKYIADKRQGGEWFGYVDKNGVPDFSRPIVEPWKCPYHNGRMCLEIIQRISG